MNGLLRVMALSATGLLVRTITALDAAVARWRPDLEGRLRGLATERLLAHQATARHDEVALRLVSPNQICSYRARSLSNKEPDTLAWIDGFRPGEVLWDIGANVGLYSLYAAKKHPGVSVYAFEPSVLNLELLVRNINLNELSSAITVVPLALFGKTGVDAFKIQSPDRGGALSAFSVDYGYDERPISPQLTYRTPGICIDDLVGTFELPLPDHVKLDVDGVKHLILAGGHRTLADARVKSVLVEINESFTEQAEGVHRVLEEAGFTCVQRTSTSPEYIDAAPATSNTIWRKGA